MGPMKEWCRFAVCWWHTFNGQMGRDPFSMDKTHLRPWDKDDSLDTFIERVHVAFEFFQKLGVEYYCFHDTDIAPQGNSLAEFQKNLDTVTDLMLEKQKETGIKLLWGTQNCFSHTRYKDEPGSRRVLVCMRPDQENVGDLQEAWRCLPRLLGRQRRIHVPAQHQRQE